jgi:hypothetical protein
MFEAPNIDYYRLSGPALQKLGMVKAAQPSVAGLISNSINDITNYFQTQRQYQAQMGLKLSDLELKKKATDTAERGVAVKEQEAPSIIARNEEEINKMTGEEELTKDKIDAMPVDEDYKEAMTALIYQGKIPQAKAMAAKALSDATGYNAKSKRIQATKVSGGRSRSNNYNGLNAQTKKEMAIIDSLPNQAAVDAYLQKHAMQEQTAGVDLNALMKHRNLKYPKAKPMDDMDILFGTPTQEAPAQ